MSSAGRGTLTLGIQQAVAFVTTILLQVVAGQVLGPVGYGRFAVVHGIVALLVYSFLTGIPHAVARTTAEERDRARMALRRGLALQMGTALLVAMGLFAVSGKVAETLGDPALGPLLRIASFALPLIGAVYVLVFSLNGLQSFTRQAIALGAYNISKFIAVAGALLLGAGLAGAVSGIVAAAALTLVAAIFLVGRLPRGSHRSGRVGLRDLAGYGAQLSVTYVAFAIWDQADLLMLKSMGDGDDLSGLYSAVSVLAGAPESIFLPVLLVLFPAMSRSAGDSVKVCELLGTSLRYAFQILLPLCAAAWLLGDEILGLVYGAEFVSVGFAAGPLAVATLFSVLYQLLDTYLRGTGRGRTSLLIAVAMLFMHVALNAVLLPRYQINGVVFSVVATAAMASLASWVSVRRSLHLVPNWTLAGTSLLAATLAFSPLALIDASPILRLLGGVLCGGLYAGLLIAFGQLGARDWARVRSMFETQHMGQGGGVGEPGSIA